MADIRNNSIKLSLVSIYVSFIISSNAIRRKS